MTMPTGQVVEDAARVGALLDAARAFRDARQAYNAVRTAKTAGRDVWLARKRRDDAINRLVDAVAELDP